MPGERILVIDRDPNTLKILEQSLGDYEFVAVIHGQEGLRLLEEPNDIDLIFLDINGETMENIDILQKIKEKHLTVGVIALSASCGKELLLSLFRYRANDVIEKPFYITEIRNKIEQTLGETNAYRNVRGTRRLKILRVKRYIDNNLEGELSLKTLARVACLGEKYLGHAFYKENGQNISEYRLFRKIERAKQWLEQGTFSKVADISRRLGYENPNTFMAKFEKIVGMTPAQYRQHRRR